MKQRVFIVLGVVLAWLMGGSQTSQAQQLPAAQRVALDLSQVRLQLTAPAGAAARPGPAPTFRLRLPTPQGAQEFILTETFVLPADDPAARQRLRTFIGYETANPTRRVALTLTANALTAQLLQGREALWLHPASAGGSTYLLEPAAAAPSGPCGTIDVPAPAPSQQRTTNASTLPAPGSFGTQLRTLRAAILVSKEFYDANKGTSSNDQNVEVAVVTIMNGMTAFYRRELSAGFTLVKPTSGPTSGYYFSAMTTATLPNTGSNVPGQVRLTNVSDVNSIVQARFNAASYDLGHCLHNTGGGVAYEPAICGSYRGGGWSGASPSGSFQQILAHEIGHQFGAGHAFNGPCGSQEVGSNLEPGGGASVMAYTYVCGTQTLINVGSTDEDHFSLRSLDQMRTRLLTAACLTSAQAIPPTANTNRPPTVNAGADYVIPTQTPFTLTATGADPDGNTLAYTWNQFDYTTNINALGTIVGTDGLAAIDDPNAPLFRPRPPRAANSRTFPDLRYILANSNQPADRVGEALPRVGRNIHFGVTVRDQVASGGAWASDNVTVTVVPNTGPFAVTTQNVAGLWIAGQSATVTWLVNGTNQAPISASNVRITLSTDGGQTFPTVLAASTPNDGSQSVSVPNVTTTQARLKVEAVGNIFFDINDVDFPIGPCAPVASQLLPATAVTANAGAAALNLSQNPYSLMELTGANQITGAITATDPTTNLINNNNPCGVFSNVQFYDSYVFVPSATATYTINTPTGFGNMVIRVYDRNGFVPGSPCQNVVANNFVNAYLPRSVTVALVAGQPYTLVLSDYGSSGTHTAPVNGNYSVTFTTSLAGGTAYAPLQSTGYDYQYAVVNTATSTVVQLAPTPDLRTLNPGTYDVYGLLFQRGYDVSGLANRSLSSLRSALTAVAPCGQFSSNARRVTITGTPLPVVLTRFTGQAAGLVNDLQWGTASEVGVVYFEVQRSLDGATFTVLGRVSATNTSTTHAYTLSDSAPPASLSYYRLRVQDHDGTAMYSPVVTVPRTNAATSAFSVQAFPNPVPAGSTLQLQLQTRETQQVQLTLTDVVGRMVWRQVVALPTGTTVLAVPATSQWQGVYVLRVQPAIGPAQQQKVLF